MGEGTDAPAILASRPPIGSLLALALHLAVVSAIALVIRYAVAEHGRLLDPSETGLFVIRVVLLGALAAVGLRSLAAAARIVQRWTTRRARVWIEGGALVFLVPPARGWSPLERRLRETRIPLSELRALRLTTSDAASLEVVAANATVVVPPHLFAVGAYTLDARIRDRTGPGAWPHPLAPVEPLAWWATSWIVRLVMPVVGVGLIAAGAAITIAQRAEGGRLGFVPTIMGMAVIGSMFAYRGLVALDPRGLFFERGGATSFIAWPELDPRSPKLRSHFASLWRELEVKSAATSSGGARRVSLNQIAWLGFPLSAMERAVREHAPKYR